MVDTPTPFPPGGQAAPPPPGETGDPSMEDILASIRRILTEDEVAAKAPDPAEELPPAAPAHDVLLLNEDMMVPDPAAPPPPSSPASPSASSLPMPLPAVPSPPLPRAAEPLVAPAAAQAAASSLGALVRTVAQERSVAVHRGGPTIEDLVREEIRPILKDWLDTNLPPLVERLVRAEIERVVGQAST